MKTAEEFKDHMLKGFRELTPKTTLEACIIKQMERFVLESYSEFVGGKSDFS